MKELLTLTALTFFGVTLACTVLFTIKSIALIKSSTFVAALITAFTFGVNTVAIKLTAGASLAVTIPLTIIANFIGVYAGKWIMAKCTKDREWRISCTIPIAKQKCLSDFHKSFEKYNIKCIEFPYNGGTIIDIFSKSQGESTLIKEIITKYNLKYSVYELDKSL